MLIVWLALTFTNKRTAKREGLFGQLIVLIFLFIGFAFVFDPNISFLIFRYSFTVTPFIGWAGVFITACGVALAIWARFIIGRNWSGAEITLKKDHKLVTAGAYGIVRHPIYTGILLSAIGTMIAKGTPGDLIGIAFLLFAFLIRIPKEERFMKEQFPAEYPSYMSRVKTLIPFVW